MEILFDIESESRYLAKRQLTSLQSLLNSLARTELLEIGKSCLLLYTAVKKTHETRVIDAFSKHLYCDTPLLDGQLRKGLVRPTNADTLKPNVFFRHQAKAAIDVLGNEIDLEWCDRDVTKFLFWTMGTVRLPAFRTRNSQPCVTKL